MQFFCRRCINSLSSSDVLAKVTRLCEKNDVTTIKFPDDSPLTWINYFHTKPTHFRIYEGFDCDSEKVIGNTDVNEVDSAHNVHDSKFTIFYN